MKKSRFTDAQVMGILHQSEGGLAAADLHLAHHMRRQPPEADRAPLHDQQHKPSQLLAPWSRKPNVFGYRLGYLSPAAFTQRFYANQIAA